MTQSLTVRLDELEHDPVAVAGHEHRLTQLDDLLASIPAKGQLQSLRVRAWVGDAPKKGKAPLYGVVAGNRRLATLRKLRESKGAILGVTVGPDYPVHVIVGEEDDTDAYEASVAENVQRLPPTVVEEVRAFAKMAATTLAKQIAAHFGITEKRVQQRLKLSQLHPDVLDALDKGKIKIGAAEAFTMEPDPERQAAYLKKAKGSWDLEPSNVKAAFTNKLVRGDSPVARLIGAKAYKAAGGKVLGDAFADGSYWISQDVIDTLLEAHWVTQKAAWLDEGWSFVETSSEFCGGAMWKLYQVETVGTKGEGGVVSYTESDRAKAGVVYFPDGAREPRIGIMRYSETADDDDDDDVTFDDLGQAVMKKLQATMDAALQQRVADDVDLTLKLLVASLRGDSYEDSGPLSIIREWEFEGEGEDAAQPTFTGALAAVASLGRDDLLAELCRAIAPGVSLGYRVGDGARAFVALAGVRIAFDAQDFFAGITKPLIQLAWADMGGEAALDDAPIGVMASVAADRAKATGWMPPQLRTASYSGPMVKTAPAADADLDADEQLQAAE